MGIFDIFKKKEKAAYHHIFEATDDNFTKQVIQRSHKTLVMVDFWAAWCGPCRMLGPVLERMAEKPDSGFMLAKLDTERNRRMASRYKIQSIPAVKFFRNGQVVGEFVGMQMEGNIRRFIGEIMADDPPKPGLKLSGNPAKRLQQGVQYIYKGMGFQAAVTLDDFPDSEEAETAVSLLPLARFLWDLDDGDGRTGIAELDDVYEETAVLLKKRKTEEALATLEHAAALGEAADQEYAQTIAAALRTLGELEA